MLKVMHNIQLSVAFATSLRSLTGARHTINLFGVSDSFSLVSCVFFSLSLTWVVPPQGFGFRTLYYDVTRVEREREPLVQWPPGEANIINSGRNLKYRFIALHVHLLRLLLLPPQKMMNEVVACVLLFWAAMRSYWNLGGSSRFNSQLMGFLTCI